MLGGSRFESGLVSHALCAAMRSMLKVNIHSSSPLSFVFIFLLFLLSICSQFPYLPSSLFLYFSFALFYSSPSIFFPFPFHSSLFFSIGFLLLFANLVVNHYEIETLNELKCLFHLFKEYFIFVTQLEHQFRSASINFNSSTSIHCFNNSI